MWRRDGPPSVGVDFAPRRSPERRPIVMVALTIAILVVLVVGVTQLLLR